jgi:hypothetical protein
MLNLKDWGVHVLCTRYIIDHHIQLAHDINLWVEEKLHDKRLFKSNL